MTVDADGRDGDDWLTWPIIAGLLVSVPTLGFLAGMILAETKLETVFVREYTSATALPDAVKQSQLVSSRSVVVRIEDQPSAPIQAASLEPPPAKAVLPSSTSGNAAPAPQAVRSEPRAPAPRPVEASLTLPRAAAPAEKPQPVLPRAAPPAARAGPVAAPPAPTATTTSVASPSLPLAALPAAPSAARSNKPAGSGVLAIQPFAGSVTMPLDTGGDLRLIDLNTGIHRSFVLERRDPDGSIATVHLENSAPEARRLQLTASGLTLSVPGRRIACGLTTDDGRDLFGPADQPYTSFCQGNLWRRATKPGWRTTQESVVQALRDSGAMGESVISFVKATVGRDEYSEKATARAGVILSAPDSGGDPPPLPARAGERRSPVDGERLGIALRDAPRALELGRWYRSAGHRGVFASVMAPGEVAPDLLASHLNRVNALDDVEREALVYLVAFDLARFELDYRVGSDHPRVGWSSRVEVAKEAGGPDGFERVTPLARVGMSPPDQLARLVATFAGGFKREHGAFKGPGLGRDNQGSHYGFVENGVVLSRPQPGLISLIGYADGTTDLKVWRPEDDARLDRIRFVRQNGTPLIEDGAPHPYVRDWLLGNWSGSAKGALRALRSGVCLQNGEGPGRARHLIYAYFTTATPSAMARVFQAYRCQTAMHLDMNAPELTYAALYAQAEGGAGVRAEHLNRAMAGSDPNAKLGQLKFATVTDNRDFFAVLRR